MKTARRVLVVDDDRAIAEVFRKVLEACGYEVSSCESGPRALEIAKETKFDALLTDYHLPGATGAALARSLRALYPDIVVIGMSGQYHGEDFKNIRGAFFLQKPVRSDHLLSLLDNAIG